MGRQAGCNSFQYILPELLSCFAAKFSLVSMFALFSWVFNQTHSTFVLKILEVVKNISFNIQILDKILSQQFTKKWQIPKTVLYMSLLSVIYLSMNYCFLFQKFKTLLLIELDKVFPKEINTYRAIRGDDRSWPLNWCRRQTVNTVTLPFELMLTSNCELCDHDLWTNVDVKLWTLWSWPMNCCWRQTVRTMLMSFDVSWNQTVLCHHNLKLQSYRWWL